MKALLLILILTSCNVFAFRAKVLRVKDGDTIFAFNDSNYYSIRLYGIDAPEKSQPYGGDATQALEKLILEKYVEVDSVNRDRYNRLVAKIFVSTKNNKRLDVGLVLINSGYAWAYPGYCKSKDYFDAENNAKIKQRGLWKGYRPERPSEYRKRKKAGK